MSAADLGFLRGADYCLSGVVVYRVRTPAGKRHFEDDRINFGLVRHVSGRFIYDFSGGERTVGAGDIILLTRGSAYTHASLEPAETVVVNFQLPEAADAPVGAPPAVIDRPPASSARLFDELCAAYFRGAPPSGLKALLYELLELLARGASDGGLEKYRAMIDPAIELLGSGGGFGIPVSELAARCYLSENAFRSAFSRCFGMTPSDYLIKRRVDRAAELLANSRLSVSAIAELLEFRDTAYFSRIFKRVTGVSPSEYRI